MPTPDELRDVQLENAKADQRFWEGLRRVHTDTIEGHKGARLWLLQPSYRP